MNILIPAAVITLLAALLSVLVRRNYSALGHWLYEHATDLEASLYKLQQKKINIGDMNMALYHHKNPGKPAIVMLHGYSADKDVWPRFARHFINDYEVIIPDLAGHGDTGFEPGWDYTMPAQADRIRRLLSALNLSEAHLIGNSMGGFLTATFAIRYPQQTLSATMVDPAGIEEYPQQSRLEKMVKAGNNPFFIRSRQDFDVFYPMTMARPPYLPDIVLNALAEKYIARREELEVIFDQFYGVDFLNSQFSQLQAPALLWWGSEDQLLDVSGSGVWQQHLPDLEVHIFAGIGHMPMLEVPSESARRYRAFLASFK